MEKSNTMRELVRAKINKLQKIYPKLKFKIVWKQNLYTKIHNKSYHIVVGKN